MDLGFIHPFLSPYDFNSDLEGCYKEGLYENLNGKAYGSNNALQKEEILDIGHPVYWATFTRSWNSSFWKSPVWLTVKPISECFWPKGNFRPVLGSHRSLWGHNKSQNKLTAALFLEHDDVKHTVFHFCLWRHARMLSRMLSRCHDVTSDGGGAVSQRSPEITRSSMRLLRRYPSCRTSVTSTSETPTRRWSALPSSCNNVVNQNNSTKTESSIKIMNLVPRKSSMYKPKV